MRVETLLAVWLAFGFVSGAAVLAQGGSGQSVAVSPEVVRATGKWGESRQVLGGGGQRWDIDALRSENQELRGRIGIVGSPLFESANVEGQLSGRGVTGKLLNDEGQELAEFEGAVTAAGASGTYRDSAGRVGEWSWTGQLKPPER